MHDSTAEINVGQKAAQQGFTETVLNITFFKIDVAGIDCLYVLPAKSPDASDFSAARFDPALELSAHLSRMFSDVKNIGHKRAGTVNLYIRGSKSRAGLKSVPTGFIALDEVDEMDQDNIPLVFERAAGQLDKQIWMLSTPTIEGVGISKYFVESSQDHFMFPCPSCGKRIELTFPDSLIVTAEEADDPRIKESHLICTACKSTLPHLDKPDYLGKGIWVPSYTGRDMRGFHVNQLYSYTVSPVDMAKASLRARRDPASEQEFYNSKLGVPHIVDGARVSDENIASCMGSHKRDAQPVAGLVTMGVDVGMPWCHYEIDRWDLAPVGSIDINVQSTPRVVTFGKVQNFEELDNLMRKYGVSMCVIDANPERRKAYEFSSRFSGRVKMCFYGRGVNGKNIHEGKDVEPTITVDRTSWLDLSLSRFKGKNIVLPIDLDHEYKSHIKALVRIYEKDADKNQVGKYVRGSEADHYAHARNYAEIALPLAASMARSVDIKRKF
jgi:hypothetical protein